MSWITRSALAAGAISLLTAVGAQAGTEGKVALCHGTASAKNMYVLIEVDQSALNGHFDGTAPGHGWKNYPDMVYDPVYASCEAQYDDVYGGGDEE